MPRKILPPPTTTPTCTPSRATAAISLARSRTRSASRPKDCGPASASPLSLRRMRSYFGTLSLRRGFWLIRSSVADLETRKTGHRDVLAELRDLRLDELFDGDGVVFHERLIVQADLFVELRHAAFHDFGRDVCR